MPNRLPKRPLKVELRHRINAGRVAVQAQTAFFKGQFGSVEAQWKEDDTRVTFADFAISEKLFADLRTDFPGDDFCSEESTPEDEIARLGGDFAWVLDPIDGTNNFYLGLPFCAISLALLHEGRPVYGFVYDFARDVIIEGGPGFDLLDGRRRIRPNAAPFGRHGVCGLHFPMRADMLAALTPLMRERRVRCFGSCALNTAYAALGKIDGTIDGHVHVWDIAGVHALIAAAGGQFHFLSADPFPMTSFRVKTPPLRFFAGSVGFCEWVKAQVPLV